jgi:hypothetical protein
MKKLSLFFALGIAAISNAQYGYRDSNRIGISAGINNFTLSTPDFDTQAGTGWNAGLSVRGNFYNNFDMVYAIQFSENQFSVSPLSPLDRDVKCKLQSAQISLLLSYVIVDGYVSVELGPMFQINGKFNIDEEDKATVINTNGLTAGELKDISQFNFYPHIGLTAGFPQLRAQLYYQYGVTNMLGKLDPPSGKLSGHGGILAANLIFYL